MASLRSLAFDKAHGKTGMPKGAFKKSGRDAAYRGTATKVFKSTGNSAKAHAAGMKASASAASSGGSM